MDQHSAPKCGYKWNLTTYPNFAGHISPPPSWEHQILFQGSHFFGTGRCPLEGLHHVSSGTSPGNKGLAGSGLPVNRNGSARGPPVITLPWPSVPLLNWKGSFLWVLLSETVCDDSAAGPSSVFWTGCLCSGDRGKGQGVQATVTICFYNLQS